MTRSEKAAVIEVVIAFVFMAVFVGFGVFFGHVCTKQRWQTDCVKRGVAHWAVGDSGRTTFQWNEPEPTP